MAPEHYEPEFHVGDVIQCDFGQFEVEKIIAVGGMGVVYQVSRPNKNAPRSYAIKTIRRDLLERKDVLARFEAEAAILAAIEHDNIVRIHGISWTTAGPRIPLILMDLLRGYTLREVLGRGDDIPLFDLCTVALGVLSALQEIHPNIVHRDIKPENIFVRRWRNETRVLLMDFGVIKQVLSTTDPTAVNDIFLGSYAYASPEQLQGFPVTSQSDLYSLGAVLYEVLARKPLFPGVTEPRELGVAQIQLRPRPLQELVPSVPRALADVIMQALQKNPSGRPKDAFAFAEPFERMRSRLTQDSVPSSTLEGLLTNGLASTGAAPALVASPLGKGATLRLEPLILPFDPDRTEAAGPPCEGGTMPGTRPGVLRANQAPAASDEPALPFPLATSARHAAHVPEATLASAEHPVLSPVAAPAPPEAALPPITLRNPSAAPGPAPVWPGQPASLHVAPLQVTPVPATSRYVAPMSPAPPPRAFTPLAPPQVAAAETPFAAFAAARPVPAVHVPLAPGPTDPTAARGPGPALGPDLDGNHSIEPAPLSALTRQRRVVAVVAVGSAVGALLVAIFLLVHLARGSAPSSAAPAAVESAASSVETVAPLPPPIPTDTASESAEAPEAPPPSREKSAQPVPSTRPAAPPTPAPRKHRQNLGF